MGKRNRTDFAVDSEGFCFLCSNKIFKLDLPKETRDETEVSKSNPIHSFHNVSKYLKMDMTKVFSETGGIPPQLLAKVQASRLKVELCEGCSSLNETFSKLHRRLEKIEMEVASCLTQMYGKLSATKEQDRDSRMTSVLKGFSEKSKILEALRTEASEKCSSRLGVGSPRIKLRNLTLAQVDAERLKFKSRSQREKDQKWGSLPSESFADQSMELDYTSNSNLLTDNDDAANDFGYDESIHQEDEQVALEFKSDGVREDTPNSGYPILPNAAASTAPKIQIDDSNYTIDAKTGKYKCNVCSKEVKDVNCFKMHYKRIHLKIRYKCSMCGREFPTNSNYHRHVKKEHLGIKFKCQGCGKFYTEKYALKKHQRSNNCGIEMTSTPIKDEPIC